MVGHISPRAVNQASVEGVCPGEILQLHALILHAGDSTGWLHVEGFKDGKLVGDRLLFLGVLGATPNGRAPNTRAPQTSPRLDPFSPARSKLPQGAEIIRHPSV